MKRENVVCVTNVHLCAVISAALVIHETFSELQALEFYWHHSKCTYKDSLVNVSVFSGK